MNDIEKIKQKLLILKAELQGLEETSKESSKPIELDQARVGRLSRMDAMQTQQMEQEVVRRQQRKLLMIDGALRRIESGDYGECFVCGEEIDMRRLAVDPTNTRCIKCADK
ncbi:TraR/DksA family transcriptional regulator [Candidatus Halobeggiatoa sp. HSG11]|nr:TraR/DksA family transcriptional regulator [Candidatus Halobeggiatoa sp. HSG11]